MSELSDRIDFLLDTKGWFRADLVRATGIKESTIRNWKDREPRASLLLPVADALEVSIRYLITGENEKQTGFHLTPQEKELISKYRQLSEHDKKIVITILEQAYASLFTERSCQKGLK